jgi:hypothetical protein
MKCWILLQHLFSGQIQMNFIFVFVILRPMLVAKNLKPREQRDVDNYDCEK